ncbi:MAG: hypothetical protein QOG32_1355, partial [Chloroflexota bacterium]|nr:hypothetical protein [Chloroflexota bacterium]
MKIRRVPLDGGRPKRPGQRPFHPSLDPRLLIWRAAFALPFVLIAFVSFGPLAVRATGPNILVNGGFEAGTPTDTAGVDRLPAGSTALTGWSVGPPASYPGSVDWTGSRWTAAEGTRSLELDGLPSEGAHSIYQDLTTVAGQTYDVTFQYSANPERFTPGPECGPNQNATPGVAVMWGGTQLGGAAVYYPATANSSAAMQWLSQSYRVAATATTTTLRFFSVDFPDRGCGLVLDDVAVVPASDFTISADPATVTMEQGTDAPVTISTGAVNATESIDFSVAVDSSGAAGSNGEDVIANVDPMTVTSGASATLAVHANLFAHTGTYIVTVTGTDTLGTAHATAVHVDVVAPGMTPSAPPTPSPDPTAAPTPTPTPTVAPTATPTPNTIQVPAGAGGAYPIDVIVPAVPPKADVLLAIDTTGSMGASIAQARADAQAIVTGVQGSVTDTQFAVVQFKDSSDTPEYQVVQAMTTSSAGITAALNGLSAGGGFDAPEAHNLVFQNSYTDPAIGWRTGTKKIVIVISDAEPHGAGAAANGLTGCADITADPHGLATATVLANMAAADRTLFMIRQAATASASLQCYQSVAARTGGSAVDGGTSTGALGSQIVTLINGAFTAATDLHVEVASATPSPASAIWISFVPPSIASVLTPSTQHFTVHVAVPAGTAAG